MDFDSYVVSVIFNAGIIYNRIWSGDYCYRNGIIAISVADGDLIVSSVVDENKRGPDFGIAQSSAGHQW